MRSAGVERLFRPGQALMRLEYFQMLDRFVEVKADERWIRAESKVPMQSPVFEGHFPGYPLMPGVLLIETMAQTCGWLVSAITGFTGLPVLAGVKEAKVRGAVFPGMEISTEGKIVHDGSGLCDRRRQDHGSATPRSPMRG